MSSATVNWPLPLPHSSSTAAMTASSGCGMVHQDEPARSLSSSSPHQSQHGRLLSHRHSATFRASSIDFLSNSSDCISWICITFNRHRAIVFVLKPFPLDQTPVPDHAEARRLLPLVSFQNNKSFTADSFCSAQTNNSFTTRLFLITRKPASRVARIGARDCYQRRHWDESPFERPRLAQRRSSVRIPLTRAVVGRCDFAQPRFLGPLAPPNKPVQQPRLYWRPPLIHVLISTNNRLFLSKQHQDRNCISDNLSNPLHMFNQPCLRDCIRKDVKWDASPCDSSDRDWLSAARLHVSFESLMKRWDGATRSTPFLGTCSHSRQHICGQSIRAPRLHWRPPLIFVLSPTNNQLFLFCSNLTTHSSPISLR